ncbi:MAG TPA: hypothetical protein VE934_15110 [Polaromonas sp.]|uniref:COG3904 family protein n=1 Tax=Polaromonas sp. TaxID=1869339 RepID=UPI002D74234F|nr:hypothetical protein [Polaromonas sp.]HYW58283.1 hypothetical protein [Polaromonas sp.]
MRVVIGFFLCLVVNAAVPTWAADVSAHQRGILIQGQIHKGDYDKIIQFVRQPGNYNRFIQSVFLDSPGGDLVETVKIANLLERSYAATHVPAGARCYSACFILWMSGVSRHVALGATLGVHRINVKVGGEVMDAGSERFVNIARRVESYMAALGTPRAILDKMNSTAPGEMFVFTQRWLAEHHLLSPMTYRLAFADAVQNSCGPDPLIAVMKDQTPLAQWEEQSWVSQVKRRVGCADELRVRNQQLSGVSITALLDGQDQF